MDEREQARTDQTGQTSGLGAWFLEQVLEYIVDVDSELLAPADRSLGDAVILFWLHFNQWRLLGDTKSGQTKRSGTHFVMLSIWVDSK